MGAAAEFEVDDELDTAMAAALLAIRASRAIVVDCRTGIMID